MKRKPEHIRQEDWDDVEIPELSEEDFARMHPAREVLPEILEEGVAAHLLQRKVGQLEPHEAAAKQEVTLSLDRDVLAYFRAKGRDWQKRVNEALRRSMMEGN